MHSPRRIARLAIAFLTIIPSAAHTLAQTPSPSNPSPAATVLQTTANLVLVDVVVTDRDNPVNGLDRSRFHVFEDGHEQPISSFDEHQPASISLSSATPLPALPPHTYTNVPAYPPSSAVNILLLDGLNTPMANQMDVRRKMIEYLGAIPPGTQLAIFTLSSRLRMVEGFTTDAAQLAKLLKSPQGAPNQSLVLDPQTDQAVDSIVGDMANMTGGAGVLDVGGYTALSTLQQFQADQTAIQTDRRVQMTLEAMQQLARYLGGIPGRKNLIWFSGSFPIALDPDDTMDDPFQAVRSYSDDIRETADLLSASRVAVYPVDARGLITPSTFDASYSPSTNLMGASVNGGRSGARRKAVANKPSSSTDNSNAQKQLLDEQFSMKQIAQQTGGQAFVNTNGLKEAVTSAIQNGSSYYTIGYVPAAHPLDRQYRKIHIDLAGSTLQLAYRRGYYADPPGKPSVHNAGEFSLIAAAALHGAPPSTQILFQARVLPATDPSLKGASLPAGSGGELSATLKGPLQRYVVDLKIDPHGMNLEPAPDGSLHARIEFLLVAYDADGRRVNYLDSGFQLSLKPGQIQKTMEDGIRLRFPIDLPAGRFYLRIAVHDLAAARAGSLEVPVTVSAN